MATAGGGAGHLKLLGAWPSPFVNRVRMALHLKGLEYENVEEDLTNKSDLLLASNPVHKLVPVLLHGNKPISESLVIVEYLDDAFPGAGQAVLPADPYERAVARFWAKYVDGKVGLADTMCVYIYMSSFPRCQYGLHVGPGHGARMHIIVQLHGMMVKALMGATEEERATATVDALAAMDTLEGAFAECSGGKKFFAGDAPGYLDVALGGFIGWLRAWDKVGGVKLLDAGRVPRLATWAERFAALDVAKEVIPDPDHIAEFAKVLQARSAAAATSN